MTEWIGFIAAACTTFAFIPQAIRVWRTHSVEDISLAMYLILVTGIALWIVYGARIHSMPVLIANCVTLVLAGAVLVGKLRFMNQDVAGTETVNRKVQRVRQRRRDVTSATDNSPS